MVVNDRDQSLLTALDGGLPLTPRPFGEIADRIGATEGWVIERLQQLRDQRVIKRFGVVVRHRELGYRANAMVVFDIENDAVEAVGARLAGLAFVTLCYRRPRRLPDWPYNLFCMIHGRDEDEVRRQIDEAVSATGIGDRPRAVLFSRKCFKQRGARYRAGAPA